MEVSLFTIKVSKELLLLSNGFIEYELDDGSFKVINWILEKEAGNIELVDIHESLLLKNKSIFQRGLTKFKNKILTIRIIGFLVDGLMNQYIIGVLVLGVLFW